MSRRRYTVSRSGGRVILDSLPLSMAEWIWVDEKTMARWQRAFKAATKAQEELEAAYEAARERRARLSAEGREWVTKYDPEGGV